jgi:ABC-type molybdate transport system permease subunit
MPYEWSLLLRDAALATLLALFTCLPLAWRLARHLEPASRLGALALLLVLILPLSPTENPIVGQFLKAGPLFILLARQAFRSVDPLHENIARTLGASEWRVFTQIAVPMAGRRLLLLAPLVFLLLAIKAILLPYRI